MIENIDGIIVNEDFLPHGIKITRVEVTSQDAAEKLNKPIRNYITVTFPQSIDTQGVLAELTVAVANELIRIMNLKSTDKVLVVGIGNRNILADSFGPRTVGKIEATRHLIGNGFNQLRPVSCISPGTIGQTGIDTTEIIHSIVKDTKPDLVIVVDSLCSPKLERLATTIQIADTGISPGSAVRETNSKIDRDTLGVPVIALGVPVVIGSADIIAGWFDVLGLDWVESEVRKVMENSPNRNETLTLKDCEEVIEILSDVISNALNAVFFSGVED